MVNKVDVELDQMGNPVKYPNKELVHEFIESGLSCAAWQMRCEDLLYLQKVSPEMYEAAMAEFRIVNG